MAKKYTEVTTPEECLEYYRLGILHRACHAVGRWYKYPRTRSMHWHLSLGEWKRELQKYKHAILVDEYDDG